MPEKVRNCHELSFIFKIVEGGREVGGWVGGLVDGVGGWMDGWMDARTD